MKRQSIIIIGGGIAGISAGCYAQMNGYQSKIFEMHDLPGGLCTSWKRKEYTIDGCVHWLVGAGNTSYFHRIWEELGVIKDGDFLFHDEFLRIQNKDKKELIVYTNIDQFEKHLFEIAPEDKKPIKHFTKMVKTFARYELPILKSQEHYNLFDVLKLLKHIPILYYAIKYKNVSMVEYAKSFKNPFLRKFFPVIFDLPDFSLVVTLFHLGWLHKKASGYPMGGSLNLANQVSSRYEELGGTIEYKKRVTRIITEDNKAVGIETADGKKHYADIIISAADGYDTLHTMLNKEHGKTGIQEQIKDLPIFPPLIQLSLGVSMDLSDKPHINFFELDEPLMINGQSHEVLKVEHSSFDTNLAPGGKTIMKVLMYSNYEYWRDKYDDRTAYKQEKKDIAGQIIERLDNYYPGLSDNIEVIDVATPVTFKRYTNNYKGTWEGWLIDTKTIDVKLENNIPGLNNFYMTGHWIAIGGGLPSVALAARNLIQKICKEDKLKFKTINDINTKLNVHFC